jgi:ABC-type amino acid transport substrate-binding protein
MGVEAQFKNVGFDGIIAALLAKKCDAIISGMTDTAERRKQVDFTDYLIVGMSLMVKKGNPVHSLHQPSGENRRRVDRGERTADRLPGARRTVGRGQRALHRNVTATGSSRTARAQSSRYLSHTGASRNCGSTAGPIPTATRANLRARRRAPHTV